MDIFRQQTHKRLRLRPCRKSYDIFAESLVRYRYQLRVDTHQKQMFYSVSFTALRYCILLTTNTEYVTMCQIT